MKPPVVDLVIPALNEEASIALVIADLPPGRVRRVVVVDNGSTDATASRAREAGAVVVSEPQRGYGAACLAGLAELRRDPPEIVVFMDGDRSDHAGELLLLLQPIIEGHAQLVIGSRVLGQRERGALTPQARFGNALACGLLRLFWGARFTDLGPFRAIRWDALERMKMEDRDFGWTVEMQIKAARSGLPCAEVPVSYRRRIGQSKISGTLSGSVRAGWKILYLLIRHGLRRGERRSPSW